MNSDDYKATLEDDSYFPAFPTPEMGSHSSDALRFRSQPDTNSQNKSQTSAEM